MSPYSMARTRILFGRAAGFKATLKLKRWKHSAGCSAILRRLQSGPEKVDITSNGSATARQPSATAGRACRNKRQLLWQCFPKPWRIGSEPFRSGKRSESLTGKDSCLKSWVVSPKPWIFTENRDVRPTPNASNWDFWKSKAVGQRRPNGGKRRAIRPKPSAATNEQGTTRAL